MLVLQIAADEWSPNSLEKRSGLELKLLLKLPRAAGEEDREQDEERRSNLIRSCWLLLEGGTWTN